MLGGCGRANGLGGPDAPADSIVEVDGDGGGRTTPPCSPFLRGSEDPDPALGECGEVESTVADPPPSEGSSGICTFRTGRFPPALSCALFVRDGGVKFSGTEDMEDMEILRFLLCIWARLGGGGDEVFSRPIALVSTDCARLLSVRAASVCDVELAQCCERIDRLSSMGVKILRDLLVCMRWMGGSSICCCCDWISSCFTCCCGGDCMGGGG